LRDLYPRIQDLGADVALIGTGDLRYAQAFVADERIPFPVLVDDEGLAAAAAGVERGSLSRLFAWASLPATVRTWRAGYRIGRPGRRVDQLGATFVLAPDAARAVRLLYQHRDAHPADHAPMAAILDALRRLEPAA
jgi:hypothetical protein